MDVIRTAIGKYSQMGLIKVDIYPGQGGAHTTWITSAKEKIEEIGKIVDYLATVQKVNQHDMTVA